MITVKADGYDNNILYGLNKMEFRYPCSSNSQCGPYSVDFYPGIYKFTACGAEGGSCTMLNGDKGVGGKGGCATGILKLRKRTNLLLYVGGRGLDTIATNIEFKPGGFNGGGGTDAGAASGAGASDVRFNSSLYSRIIVGGGGGGANDLFEGGNGGGVNGGNGKGEALAGYDFQLATGGTQTSGGTGEVRGDFGIGGGAKHVISRGAGGGSGWYGGGLGTGPAASGGGGSGYISGHPECKQNPKYRFSHPSFEGTNEGNGKIIVETLELQTNAPRPRKIVPLAMTLLLL